MLSAQSTMRRIALQLVQERTQSATEELSTKGVSSVDGEKTVLGKDILSVLSKLVLNLIITLFDLYFTVRSSLAASPSQQMSINEITSQISTFIAAGHETTSNALTWCLYALVKDPKVQEKLRMELLQIHGAHNDKAQIEGAVMRCEYLDWVVRESLRLHCPVTSTMRVCMRDEDEIPVNTRRVCHSTVVQ